MEKYFQDILISEGIEIGLFDKDEKLTSHSENFHRILSLKKRISLKGLALTYIVPEFVGLEDSISHILKNPGEDYELERVHRETPEGNDSYISFRLLGLPSNTMLLIARDITPIGQLEQKLTQQRNELDLVSRQLTFAHGQINELFRRFVPTSIVDEMLENSDMTRPGGKRRRVTTMFADLRQFTEWAEVHEPEMVLSMLNDQLSNAIDILIESGATVNQFIGDGFISFFNAPLDQPNHADLAIECAKKIVAIQPDVKNVQFGIGINSGPVVAGNIGSIKLMNYTVIGTAVNIASRIEKLAGPGEIVFGESTKNLLTNEHQYTLLGPHKLKGISQPINIYKLT